MSVIDNIPLYFPSGHVPSSCFQELIDPFSCGAEKYTLPTAYSSYLPRNIHDGVRWLSMPSDLFMRVRWYVSFSLTLLCGRETLEVAKSAINDALRRFRETGSYERRAGSGRPRATTEVDDRFITLSVLRDRHLTAPEVRDRLLVARNTRVSSDTVRR
uniref:Paired domain-containing protein n=1 Tax=Rhodnius prolixus TaxID=13249 RepID=T1I6E4_RHOPR